MLTCSCVSPDNQSMSISLYLLQRLKILQMNPVISCHIYCFLDQLWSLSISWSSISAKITRNSMTKKRNSSKHTSTLSVILTSYLIALRSWTLPTKSNTYQKINETLHQLSVKYLGVFWRLFQKSNHSKK